MGLPLGRLGLVLALAVILVTVTWGPITPSADAHAQAQTPSSLDEPPWHAWRTETLNEDTGLNPETEVGPDGTTWLAHAGWAGSPLKLLHRDSEGWSEETIPSSNWEPRGLAIDEEGRPWVSWSEAPTAQVARHNTTDDWWVLTLPEGQSYPQIDLDPDGILHVLVVTHDGGSGPVYHATFDPTQPKQGWTTTQITTSSFDDRDMAIGPEGRVHAVWDEDKAQYIEQQPDDTWTTKTLHRCDWGETAIEATPDGTVHIACKSGNEGLIYYHRNPEGAWSSEIASDGSQLMPSRHHSEIAYENDIAVDDEGRPHIVYTTSINPWRSDDPFHPGRPVYTVKLADGWHVNSIDREGAVTGDVASIALDPAGRPQVGYVYGWRIGALGCSDVVNPCFTLRYAEPVSATAAWAADSAANHASIAP